MYTRTKLLIKEEGLNKLKKAHVLVVGLGGVGGYAAEQLCRSGIGKLTLVDGDTVSESNMNRQLIALHNTIGMLKTEVLQQRLRNINPNCEIKIISEFIRDDRMIEILKDQNYNYVIDAIDTLSPKVFLIYHCLQLQLPVVSSMGSAGKFDPSLVEVSDVSKSHTCPLAYLVRKRLSKLGIKSGFQVVYSSERIPEYCMVEEFTTNKRTTVGSISYMPPLFGCFCASVVIRDILR